MPLLIVLGVLVLAVVWGVAIYNRLVRLRTTMQSSWSDIDVLLKKRYDLVDNLVETVKGYAAHEKGTLQGVTEARSRAMQAVDPASRSAAENALSGTLKSLFAVSEAYPDLKANQSFVALQQQLAGIEGEIEYARRYFNAVVRDLNTAIDSVPSNLVASSFGFSRGTFFQLESAAEKQPVKVKF